MLISHRQADIVDRFKELVLISFIFQDQNNIGPETNLMFLQTTVEPEDKRYVPNVERAIGNITKEIGDLGNYVAGNTFLIKMPVFDMLRILKASARQQIGFVDVTILREPSSRKTTLKIRVKP